MPTTCHTARITANYTQENMINDIKNYITSIHSSKINIISQLDIDKQRELATDIIRYFGLTKEQFIIHIQCNDDLKKKINIYLNSYNFGNLTRGGDKKNLKKYRKKSRKSRKYKKSRKLRKKRFPHKKSRRKRR